MKFIISSLSMSMFTGKNFDLIVHELSEDEFQALAIDAYSCIGQPDIAKLTGYAYNREMVKTRAGDVLLLAQIYNDVLRFHCIQVRNSETQLLRDEEMYIEEEMI